MRNKILQGNALDVLKTLEDESIDCVITSPPYFGLRDYGVEGQIGLEDSPEAFVEVVVSLFREVRRVLKKEGTVWLNLGDSYAGGAGRWGGEKNISSFQAASKGSLTQIPLTAKKWKHPVIKPKDLMGIPWRVALALQADGWYLRQDIIWSKPNPMPESVTDRCTRAHEYVFMLSKSPKYYYDHNAIKTPAKDPEDDMRRLLQQKSGNKSEPDSMQNGLRPRDKQRGHSRRHAGFNDRWDQMSKEAQVSLGANKRSVWTVATRPFKEAHFATFPESLIEPMVLAGCPTGGGHT